MTCLATQITMSPIPTASTINNARRIVRGRRSTTRSGVTL
jgi:hypothetical protein